MRRMFAILGLILGAYLIVRAIVELVTLDHSDPSTYADDWGGPSLAGVVLVHAGPGLLALVVILVLWRRSRRGAL